jgi:hypothetical protein
MYWRCSGSVLNRVSIEKKIVLRSLFPGAIPNRVFIEKNRDVLRSLFPDLYFPVQYPTGNWLKKLWRSSIFISRCNTQCNTQPGIYWKEIVTFFDLYFPIFVSRCNTQPGFYSKEDRDVLRPLFPGSVLNREFFKKKIVTFFDHYFGRAELLFS